MVVFVLFSVTVHQYCRKRNVLDRYPNGDGFPVLVHNEGRSDRPDFQLQLTKLPLRPAGRGRSQGTLLLPNSESQDAGVFQGTYVNYSVRPLEGDRIRVRLRRYGETRYAPWDVAVYDVSGSQATPIYINGGSEGAAAIISALLSVLLTYIVHRMGHAMVFLAGRPSIRESLEVLRQLKWYEDPFLLVILIPFVHYLSVLTLKLVPYNSADSYAWLWRRTFNVHFFAGRCLTQRIVFFLCGGNLRVISVVQLLIFAATAVLTYSLLRRGSLLFRILLASFVTFFFSSYTLNVAAITISSEPMFTAAMIAFPLVLFLWPDRFWGTAVFCVGVSFIFSKNIAPFLVLALLVLYLVLMRRPAVWKRVTVCACLSLVTVASIVVTNLFDASLEMNVVNSICRRVLVDPDATRSFQETYGMPEGDYVEQLAGKECNALLDGRRLYTVETRTMNFRLENDEYGFIEWARNRGRRAYVRFLLLDQPVKTYRDFRNAFAEHYCDRTVRFAAGYMGPKDWRNPKPPNHRVLSGGDPGKQIGFLGFDAPSVLNGLWRWLGFARVELLIAYCLVGCALVLFARVNGLVPVTVALIGESVGMFFISYFGDGGGVQRHVFPAFVLLAFAGAMMVVALVDVVRHFLVGRARRPAGELQQSL